MSQTKENMRSKAIKPFSRSVLIKIKETLEQTGSPTDRLLFSLMLTGMRPSEYLPMKIEELRHKFAS
jgi:integrase